MYPNLKAEMARSGITSKDLATELGINPATMSAKLNQFDRIKLCECYKIKKHFFPDKDISYLFSIGTDARDSA